MKHLILGLLLITACRPADGSSETAAPAAATQSPPAVTADPAQSGGAAAAPSQGRADSARMNALLERADAARIQGARTAPVWIVELSDFQCPFCKRFHEETYPALKREFITPGHVRFAYVNLPLSIHPNAPHTAEAAMCAAAQDRFWQMHDVLFDTQERWAPLPSPVAFVDSLAVAVGVNITDWRECMRSGVMRRLVNADKSRGASAGVRSTPTFFVGDQGIAGAAPIDSFRVMIARQRAKAASRPPQ